MTTLVKFALFVAAIVLGAIGLSVGIGHSQASTPKHYLVESGDFYFDPPGLLIQPGDMVEWAFVEITVDGHTTTAYHPNYKKELRMPEGAKPWDSDLILDKSKTYSVRFETVGIYDYFCLFHEFLGMIGRIIVKEPIGPVAAKPSVTGLPPAAAKEMPAIDEIMGPVGKIFNFTGELNLVTQLYRLGEIKKSSEILNRLVTEFKTGTEKIDSLYEILKKVNLLTELEESLAVWQKLMAEPNSLEKIEAQAKINKNILKEARQRLNKK